MVRVLYVDDSSDFREMVRAYLRQRLGMEIMTANSGNEAIELLKQGCRYDLIISDYEMANGSGADLFKFATENRKFGLFILFTSHNVSDEMKRKFKSGPDFKIVSKTEIKSLASIVVMGLSTGKFS